MAEGSPIQSKWTPDDEDIAYDKLERYRAQGKRAYITLIPVYGDSDRVGCTIDCVCEDDEDFIEYDEELLNKITCTCSLKEIGRDHCYVHDNGTRKAADKQIAKGSKCVITSVKVVDYGRE